MQWSRGCGPFSLKKDHVGGGQAPNAGAPEAAGDVEVLQAYVQTFGYAPTVSPAPLALYLGTPSP